MRITRRNKFGGSPRRRRRSKSKKRAKTISPKRARSRPQKHRVYSARHSPGARKRWDSSVRRLPDYISIEDAFAYDYGKPAVHGRTPMRR
jgi:hypothetical protein